MGPALRPAEAAVRVDALSVDPTASTTAFTACPKCAWSVSIEKGIYPSRKP